VKDFLGMLKKHYPKIKYDFGDMELAIDKKRISEIQDNCVWQEIISYVNFIFSISILLSYYKFQ